MYDNKITVIFKYLSQLKQTITLEEKFFILINMAKELIDADRCSIWKYNKQTNKLEAKFAHGLDIELVEPTSSGIVGQCFLTRETIIIDNVREDIHFNKSIDQITGYNTKSLVSIPIINSSHEVLGVFQALNKKTQGGVFNNEDIQLMDLVTLYIAEVLDSSYLYEQLEIKIAQEIEKNKQKDEMLFEQAKYAALGDMIGNIAHQWRQPLSAITLTASGVKLEHDLGVLEPNNIPLKMNSIIEKSKYLSNTIDIFRNFIKNEKTYKSLNILQEIKEAINIVQTVLDDESIDFFNEINMDQEIKINTVSGELQQVIVNIINNAKDVLVASNMKNRWVKIDLKEHSKDIEIVIEDNGGGIPNSIINRIFEPYFTTKHQSQGTGLGLHICYKIITESMGGTIEVENSSNGALFRILIPKNHKIQY